MADGKYFKRVKWQYMVLDEAQAIKSSNRFGLKSSLMFIKDFEHNHSPWHIECMIK